MKSICYGCENYMRYADGCQILNKCIFGAKTTNTTECSHFKAKPTALEELKRVQEETKDSELKQQAEKDLDKKGENIIPTLCESCNCMTKTISTRTESYCGKCKKPKA